MDRREKKGTKSLSLRTVDGIVWSYLTKYGAKFVNLAGTAVLAHLLTQEDFGVAGYALVFVGFLEILDGFGVGSGVIYLKEKKSHLNSAFWMSTAAGFILGGICFLFAPLAGVIFADARAVPVTQALSVVFPIISLRTVHKALLRKQLQFAKIAVPEFSRVGVKAIVGIAFALNGWGAWSLVFAQIAGFVLETVVFWIVNPWRPSFPPSVNIDSVKILLSYGSGIAVLNVLGVVISNIDFVLVGRYLGAAALGTYMLGFRLPNLLVTQLCRTLSQVIFPVFVGLRAQGGDLSEGWLMALRYLAIVTVPVGLGLAAIAEPAVHIVFGSKWENAIPVVMAISLHGLIISFYVNIGDVYKATGRVKLLVVLSFVQAVITVSVLWFCIQYYPSIAVIAWAHVAIAFFMMILRVGVAVRILEIEYTKVVKAIYRPLVCGLVMYFLIFQFISHSSSTHAVNLLLGSFIGFATYMFLGYILLRKDAIQAIKLVKNRKRK